MFPKPNGVIPPQPGSPVPYICQECGEHFTAKKSIFPKQVRCPKCGSIKCVSPVVH